ncbi:MAG: cytochrome C oxidase subunit IV family protein [Ilumatobacteraceae bacterium]
MSTVIEPTPTTYDGHEESDAHVPGAHKTTAFYVKVALVLAVMTAAETSTYWVDFGKLFMPVLLILMVAKFFTVVSLFMHLKYDNRLFALLFYMGLFLAVAVYVAALATFKLFASH